MESHWLWVKAVALLSWLCECLWTGHLSCPSGGPSALIMLSAGIMFIIRPNINSTTAIKYQV